MKKLIIATALMIGLSVSSAHAAVAPVASAPAVAAGSNFWLFFGAIGFAAAVEYADAEGIAFPLCGFAGLKCYDDEGYPLPVHGDGV